MDQNQTVRGSYRKWLTDPNAEIPRTTQFRNKEKAKETDVSSEIDAHNSVSDEETKLAETVYSRSNHQEGKKNEDTWNFPLHPSSPLTFGESLLLILSFKLRHGLSKQALNDLLELFNSHFPNTFDSSIFLFLKKFSDAKSDLQVHFLCNNCHNYLGMFIGEIRCEFCNHVNSVDVNKKNKSFFYYMPLGKQIELLLQERSIVECLFSHIVHAGDEQPNFNFKTQNSFNLSLLWNCDGVPLFSSNNVCIWPLQCVITQLSHKLQRENIIVAGLWFGQGKPKMDAFLKPFIEESILLESEGITWSRNGMQIKSKIEVHICSSDAVARPLLRNTIQFNGKHGCDWCYHEGEQIKKGNGTVRIYPYLNPEPILRDSQTHLAEALDATENGRIINGVKGVSMLMCVPSFDMITGFVPDYMHAVLLGVTRQFSRLWFDSCYHDKSWYLGNQIELLDTFILAQKPPREIARHPRSLVLRKFWKATEWKSFLLYYSPAILFNILPLKFFNHWLLLLFAMHMLLKDIVTDEIIVMADKTLAKFVIMTESLYGKEFLSFNVHQLTHLCLAVRKWGPLWKTSAFMFENYNGCLIKLFNGTNYVPEQMCEAYLMKKYVLNKVCELFSQSSSSSARQLLSKLLYGKSLCKSWIPISRNIIVCGRVVSRKLTPIEKLATQTVFQNIRGYVKSYSRIICNNQLFSTKSYSLKFKTHNSVTRLKNGMFLEIESLFWFTHCSCSLVRPRQCGHAQTGIAVGKCLIPKKQFFKDTDVGVSSNTAFFQVNLHKCKYVATGIDNFDTKCVFIQINEQTFIATPPNVAEFE